MMPALYRLMFLVAIGLAVDLYAYQAIRTVGRNWSPILFKSVSIAFWSISLITVVFFSYNTLTGNEFKDENSTTRLLRIALTMIFICKLPIIGTLLVDDARRGIRWLYHQIAAKPVDVNSRNRFLSSFGIFAGLLPLAVLSYGIIRNAYRYKVHRVQIPIKGLPANLVGLKIVQISDIHAGSFTRKTPLYRAIELINQEQPDLVFFTGDLVNTNASEMENYYEVFDKIRAKHGVYSTMGNHDYYSVRWWKKEEVAPLLPVFRKVHERLGWKLLLNENEVIEVNGEKIAIIGVENQSAHRSFPQRGNLNQAAEGTAEAAVRLLLSHDPSHWDSEINKQFAQIEVTFSGHTHGFQFGIEIPGIIKWSPSQYLYKQWAGLYKKGEQYLYVNRGLGFLGYPGRVGILAEVTVAELITG